MRNIMANCEMSSLPLSYQTLRSARLLYVSTEKSYRRCEINEISYPQFPGTSCSRTHVAGKANDACG